MNASFASTRQLGNAWCTVADPRSRRIRSRRPFVTPLWFVDDDGALYVTTAATSRAARNVATHPAVAMLLHGDRYGRRDRVLLLRGSATVHHAFPSWRVLAKLALKYQLSPRGALSELRHSAQWPLRLRYYADPHAASSRAAS